MSRRWRMRGILVSVVVGLGALVLSWAGVWAAKARGTVVLVAARALSAGQTLGPTDVRTLVLAGHVPKPYLTMRSHVFGRILTHDVVQGQPLLAQDIAAHALRQGLAAGQVGVFVPVNLAGSAEALPGDYVDVIWAGSTNPNGTALAGLSPGTTLLQHVKVIADVTSSGAAVQVGTKQTVSSYSSVPAAVELAVPLQKADVLTTAASAGQVWLVLDPWGTVSSPTVQAVQGVASEPSSTRHAGSPVSGSPTATTSASAGAPSSPAP